MKDEYDKATLDMFDNKETRTTLIRDIEDGKYDDEYAEYILDHACGDRLIVNGDTLIGAMESSYLYNDFVEYKTR